MLAQLSNEFGNEQFAPEEESSVGFVKILQAFERGFAGGWGLVGHWRRGCAADDDGFGVNDLRDSVAPYDVSADGDIAARGEVSSALTALAFGRFTGRCVCWRSVGHNDPGQSNGCGSTLSGL